MCFFRVHPESAAAAPPYKVLRRLMAVLVIMTVLQPLEWCVMAAEEPTDATTYYNKYNSLSTEQVYKQGLKEIQAGHMNEAMVCFTIAAGRYEDDMDAKEKRTCAYALNNAGAVAMLRSDYSMAFSYFTKAIEIADDSLLYQSFNNIAGVYLYFNDYANARKYLNMAYETGFRQKDWNSMYNTLHNMLDLDWDTDSLQNSMERIARFRQLKEPPHDEQYQYIASICDGMEAYHHHSYPAAIAHFEKAIASSQGMPFQTNHEIPVNLYIANAYLQQHDYARAIHYLSVCEKASKESGALDMLIKTYRYQSLCYAEAGDPARSREAKYRYMEIRDSINNANEYGKIKDMQFFHDLGNYEKEVARLTSEKKMHDTVLFSIIGFLLVALVFLVVSMIQNRKLKRSNKDLFDKNVALLRQEEVEQQLRKAYAYKKEQLEAIESDSGRYKGSSLTDESREQLLARIRDVMHNPEEFCQEDFTIERLASAIGSNTKYVSQVINEMLGKNFNTLLNEQRIGEVCKRLVDTEHYGGMTLEAVATEAGFKSRSHFIRTFKKITGLTPSQYQRMAREEFEARQA